MTALAMTQDEARPALPDVWDETRLSELLDDVGDAGLRDLLRLFQADMGFLLEQLARAIEAGDSAAAGRLLGMARDAAEALGLCALSALLRDLRSRPADNSFPGLVARELSRIRFVPSPKRAS
jgi:hypothetical protein